MSSGALERGKTISLEALSGYERETASIKERFGHCHALVLIDLDGTLIRDDYLPVDLERYLEVSERLKQKGIILGLHSDSPLASLLQFHEIFQTNGPLIYEKAGIYLPNEESLIALDISVAHFFQNFREAFYYAAKARFPDTPRHRHLISYTEDKNKQRREGTRYPDFTHGLWLNPFRQFSFHFWAEGIAPDGTPYLNPVFHAEIDELARECLEIDPAAADVGNIVYRSTLSDGTSIARPNRFSSKTTPIRVLLDIIGTNHPPLYMIGNTLDDLITDERVKTLAVSNADPDLQSAAHAISTQPYTAGVTEHLEYIEKALGL